MKIKEIIDNCPPSPNRIDEGRLEDLMQKTGQAVGKAMSGIQAFNAARQRVTNAYEQGVTSVAGVKPIQGLNPLQTKALKESEKSIDALDKIGAKASQKQINYIRPQWNPAKKQFVGHFELPENTNIDSVKKAYTTNNYQGIDQQLTSILRSYKAWADKAKMSGHNIADPFGSGREDVFTIAFDFGNDQKHVQDAVRILQGVEFGDEVDEENINRLSTKEIINGLVAGKISGEQLTDRQADAVQKEIKLLKRDVSPEIDKAFAKLAAQVGMRVEPKRVAQTIKQLESSDIDWSPVEFNTFMSSYKEEALNEIAKGIGVPLGDQKVNAITAIGYIRAFLHGSKTKGLQEIDGMDADAVVKMMIAGKMTVNDLTEVKLDEVWRALGGDMGDTGNRPEKVEALIVLSRKQKNPEEVLFIIRSGLLSPSVVAKKLSSQEKADVIKKAGQRVISPNDKAMDKQLEKLAPNQNYDKNINWGDPDAREGAGPDATIEAIRAGVLDINILTQEEMRELFGPDGPGLKAFSTFNIDLQKRIAEEIIDENILAIGKAPNIQVLEAYLAAKQWKDRVSRNLDSMKKIAKGVKKNLMAQGITSEVKQRAERRFLNRLKEEGFDPSKIGDTRIDDLIDEAIQKLLSAKSRASISGFSKMDTNKKARAIADKAFKLFDQSFGPSSPSSNVGDLMDSIEQLVSGAGHRIDNRSGVIGLIKGLQGKVANDEELMKQVFTQGKADGYIVSQNP